MTQRFDQPKQMEVTSEEVLSLYATPAIYTNKYYVTTQPDGMVRLTFSDTDPSEKKAFPRVTVIMPVPAFLAFAGLINSNVGNIQKAQTMMMQRRIQMPVPMPEPVPDQSQDSDIQRGPKQ